MTQRICHFDTLQVFRGLLRETLQQNGISAADLFLSWLTPRERALAMKAPPRGDAAASASASSQAGRWRVRSVGGFRTDVSSQVHDRAAHLMPFVTLSTLSEKCSLMTRVTLIADACGAVCVLQVHDRGGRRGLSRRAFLRHVQRSFFMKAPAGLWEVVLPWIEPDVWMSCRQVCDCNR